jgi:hypothetical protein
MTGTTRRLRDVAYGQGTFRAHHSPICPEILRTDEISAADQSTWLVHPAWSGIPAHQTRPTGRLTPLVSLTWDGIVTAFPGSDLVPSEPPRRLRRWPHGRGLRRGEKVPVGIHRAFGRRRAPLGPLGSEETTVHVGQPGFSHSATSCAAEGVAPDYYLTERGYLPGMQATLKLATGLRITLTPHRSSGRSRWYLRRQP